jgi:hypothetical protein
MLSVVGFAETANAWPAKIAAANPAMTISRRGWSWKDTIAWGNAASLFMIRPYRCRTVAAHPGAGKVVDQLTPSVFAMERLTEPE